MFGSTTAATNGTLYLNIYSVHPIFSFYLPAGGGNDSTLQPVFMHGASI